MDAMTNTKRWCWLDAHLAWHGVEPRHMTHPVTGNSMRDTIERARRLQRLNPKQLDHLADTLGFERESFEREFQKARLGQAGGHLTSPAGLLPATGQVDDAPDETEDVSEPPTQPAPGLNLPDKGAF